MIHGNPQTSLANNTLNNPTKSEKINTLRAMQNGNKGQNVKEAIRNKKK